MTAAGGKVDLRLKMDDAVKAQLLLGDFRNYPSLVTEKGAVLPWPDESKKATLKFRMTAC